MVVNKKSNKKTNFFPDVTIFFDFRLNQSVGYYHNYMLKGGEQTRISNNIAF